MVARRVRCRGGAVRWPVVSSPNRSASRSAICSTDSARTRAAASSIASGTPSSARHSAATAPALAGPMVNPGRDAAARSANSRIASYRVASSAASIGPSGATDSGGTCHTVSAATRSGSRLVAIRLSPGEESSRRWATAAHASIRCSQLSRTSSSRRGATASASVSSSGRPGSSPMPSADAARDTTRSACHRSPRSTKQPPSGNAAATVCSTCWASRVFPMPPGPQSVSARVTPSSSHSSVSSRSRPTKLFGSWGTWIGISVTSLPRRPLSTCHAAQPHRRQRGMCTHVAGETRITVALSMRGRT